MLAAKDDKVVIVEYMRKRLEYLRECTFDIENRLRDNATEFINTCEDDNACNEYLWHIENAVRHPFRYSMLIAACTFLEESVKFICSNSVPDCGKKLKASRPGTWLAKHRQLLADNTLIDVSAIAKDLDTMEDLIQVRNCIVHNWGRVDGNEQRRGKIVKIIKDREDCFVLSADGFLYVTDQAVPTAFTASRHIVSKLLKDLFGLPGHCVS